MLLNGCDEKKTKKVLKSNTKSKETGRIWYSWYALLNTDKL